jgi:spore germination cell wall hydrolase CwlJ-like protein
VPDLKQLSDQELLTACLWAEARSESREGQNAVCNVILNRVRKKMAKSIRDVILAAGQFSWTDPTDANYSKVLKAPDSDPIGWHRAIEIATQALTGTLSDNTRNADHYLNVEATRRRRKGTLPKWAQEGIDNGKVTVVIGNHTFLNLLG